MKAYERLLKYVTFRTPSDENSENTPSSACQFELARFLKNEMEGLNLSDIVLDDMCYLYGKLPATKGMKMCLLSDLLHIWIPCPIIAITILHQ